MVVTLELGYHTCTWCYCLTIPSKAGLELAHELIVCILNYTIGNTTGVIALKFLIQLPCFFCFYYFIFLFFILFFYFFYFFGGGDCLRGLLPFERRITGKFVVIIGQYLTPTLDLPLPSITPKQIHELWNGSLASLRSTTTTHPLGHPSKLTGCHNIQYPYTCHQQVTNRHHIDYAHSYISSRLISSSCSAPKWVIDDLVSNTVHSDKYAYNLRLVVFVLFCFGTDWFYG